MSAHTDRCLVVYKQCSSQWPYIYYQEFHGLSSFIKAEPKRLYQIIRKVDYRMKRELNPDKRPHVLGKPTILPDVSLKDDQYACPCKPEYVL